MGRTTALFLILAASILGATLLVLTPEGKRMDVEVILVGDMMLGRTVMTKSLDLGDPTYPFAKVAERLRGADIVFGNLEAPFVENCPRDYFSLKFCAAPVMAEGLTFAGVDAVSLANNHSRNYGKEGLEETKKILSEKDIKWTGDGGLRTITARGTKFGFLGFDLTARDLTESDLKLIRESDNKVDVLLVGAHWGVEYRSQATELQRNQSRRMIEAGADVIAGHHPHWVQDKEFYQVNQGNQVNQEGTKLVYYSLGNFVFDQMWSIKTREGLAVSLTFRDGELREVEEMSVFMENWAQPEWVE